MLINGIRVHAPRTTPCRWLRRPPVHVTPLPRVLSPPASSLLTTVPDGRVHLASKRPLIEQGNCMRQAINRSVERPCQPKASSDVTFACRLLMRLPAGPPSDARPGEGFLFGHPHHRNWHSLHYARQLSPIRSSCATLFYSMLLSINHFLSLFQRSSPVASCLLGIYNLVSNPPCMI